MNTPGTINIEKYAEALNNLVGMDIGYLGDSDENVNAIVEVIVAAKALENRVKELTEEIKDLEAEYDRVYEQAAADIKGNMADGGTSCHWCADKTKADTVREFASYLKKYSFCCDPGNWMSFDAIDADELDNYVQEFLEGKK